jgi:Fic family protein
VIFRAPKLDEADVAVLSLISRQRERLKMYTQSAPSRWFGSLRRTTMARAIQGSNSIEGYDASLDEAVAAVENDPSLLDERTETWLAIRGYRNALTYINQASQDQTFEFSKQFLKSLHFMMLGHDMAKHPGQWRPGSIFVVNQRTGLTVYNGPDVELVNPLVEELIAYLKGSSDEPNLVKAALAHLNLTMIHPFKDGNGRMARALQTLVIALDGILHPVFSSIEEWLGQHTEEYYEMLALTGKGEWNPYGSTQAWVRFCLKAHHQQAATLIRRNEEYSLIYEGITEIVKRHKLDERSSIPLFDAALGLRLTNSRYRTDAEVSELVASRDLKKLCDAGLLEPYGEKRGRFYRSSAPLKDLRQSIRTRKPLDDPYELVARQRKSVDQEELPRLPGI